MIGAVLAVGALAAPPLRGRGLPRRVGLTAVLGVMANLPWLIPAMFAHASGANPSVATSVFRARADSPLGTAGSLLSLGGLWRTDLAPPGRNTLGWVPAFVLIAAIAVWGWGRVGRAWPRGAMTGLLAVSSVGFVLALAPAVPGLRGAYAFLAREISRGGILRDSHGMQEPEGVVGTRRET